MPGLLFPPLRGCALPLGCSSLALDFFLLPALPCWPNMTSALERLAALTDLPFAGFLGPFCEGLLALLPDAAPSLLRLPPVSFPVDTGCTTADSPTTCGSLLPFAVRAPVLVRDEVYGVFLGYCTNEVSSPRTARFCLRFRGLGLFPSSAISALRLLCCACAASGKTY